MLALFTGAILVVAFSIARALWPLVSPAARDRELRRLETDYAREMAAIQRDMKV